MEAWETMDGNTQVQFLKEARLVDDDKAELMGQNIKEIGALGGILKIRSVDTDKTGRAQSLDCGCAVLDQKSREIRRFSDGGPRIMDWAFGKSSKADGPVEHKGRSSCCRLDRFIFTPEWEELFPNVRQITLARVTSDHCPVQLDTSKLKWGPSPFRFENSWLRHPEFKEKLKEWWRQETFQGWEGYKFMKKLKFLKGKIKHWSREKFGEVGKVKEEVKARLIEIDLEEGREGWILQRGRKEKLFCFN
ncbi:hypothetical protein M0R45_035548 [Rubus argutus]|uniref:Uncharacterized protein n=1 Tax=Rubus argutus TaxID=59490 RepID=A0AAW1VXA2_RUBAR